MFEVGKGEVEMAMAEAEGGIILPPFSPGTPSLRGGTQMKVCITWLHMEAQERTQAWQAELDWCLQVRRLEIQAEKEVNLRKLEIDAAKVVTDPTDQQN